MSTVADIKAASKIVVPREWDVFERVIWIEITIYVDYLFCNDIRGSDHQDREGILDSIGWMEIVSNDENCIVQGAYLEAYG